MTGFDWRRLLADLSAAHPDNSALRNLADLSHAGNDPVFTSDRERFVWRRDRLATAGISSHLLKA